MKTITSNPLWLMIPLIGSANLALGQTIDFNPYETGGISNLGDLDAIMIQATFNQLGSDLEIILLNSSTPGDDWITSEVPTITKIAFDDNRGNASTGFIDGLSFEDSPKDVDFNLDNSVNIPGSNNINFSTVYGVTASPPPTKTGIDPGEQIRFILKNAQASEALKLVQNDQLRIAIHVQQIGLGDDSASFVSGSSIPEPTSSALMGLAGLGLLLKRRRS